jgi:hypothetical protein
MRRPPVTPDGAGTGGGPASRYFYLSYPRTRPLPPVEGLDLSEFPDEWVRELFRDLGTAVRGQADQMAAIRPGFLDPATLRASDTTEACTDALSVAEVFVPLLSPEYFRRSWSGREWASFEQRLLGSGVTEPLQRFVPVLWSPLSSGEHQPGLAQALDLASPDAAGPYAENGLRALLRLPRYREAYQRVVDSLAARVVALAERVPVGPFPAPDPGRCGNLFAGDQTGRVFALTIAAPAGHLDGCWDPFRHHPWLPVQEYAGAATERQGFAVHAPDFEKSAEVFRRAPGAVLIDPGYVPGTSACLEMLALLSELPSWVLPVLITGRDDIGDMDSAGTEALRSCVANSYNAYQSYPDTVRRGLRGVSSLRELLTLMPFVVSQAEREYLRHGPIRRSAARPAFRLRPV